MAKFHARHAGAANSRESRPGSRRTARAAILAVAPVPFRRGMMLALGLMGLFFLLHPARARADALLSGPEIREIVLENRVYLATPLGGELPLNYRANGVVDGSGEAIGLGRFLQPKDKGRWWIADNRLCQQWERWYDGAQMCFTLRRAGDNALVWQKDDGESGRARLARN